MEVPARTKVEPIPKVGNLFIDFEFNRVNERYVNLVCAVVHRAGITYKFWLHNDRKAQRQLASQLDKWLQERRMVCYGAIAESRALQALGLNPLDYEIIDLWAEVRQLHNHNDRYQYGRYLMGGIEYNSKPPHVIPAMNKGKDMREIGTSLADSTYFFLGRARDTIEKKAMRDLIIEDHADYSAYEREKIMGYCAEDVDDLPDLHKAISMAELKELGFDAERLIRTQVLRGSDSASMAMCESEGIPLDVEAAAHLSSNVEFASREIIEDLNTRFYKFFEQKEDGTYVQKYELFAEWVESNGLGRNWPKTSQGKYAADEETLEDYAGFSHIKQLIRVRSILQQLKWFRDESWGRFFSAVDINEKRLRVWLNPFGTQSNRNAPPAKLFVPAMSNWLRCLIRPMKGQAITGIDWSSQEFAIAAILSKDPKMIEAYRSGDPYVFFAKEAGAIPADANPKWVKDPGKAPPELQEEYLVHQATRDLFKSTVLGLQYGMGVEKLARKLSSDTGLVVTVDKATQLRDMHKRVFHVYWAWLDLVTDIYAKRPLILADGWAMFQDNRSALSVKNFPVQGTGSAIMRLAVRKAQREGIKVLFPLHDAIYILHDEGDEKTVKRMEELMDEAVVEILGDSLYIRHESKTVTHEETWVEKRGKKMYELLSKYLKPIEKPVEPPKEKKKTVRKKKSTTSEQNVLDLETSSTPSKEN